MEKKRSKGVTFWAWVFIISAIIGFLSVKNLNQQIQIFGIGLSFFKIAVSLAHLICGIYLLKLNNSARKTAIILGIISIVAIPSYLKPIFRQLNSDDYYAKQKQVIIEQVKPELQQKALENLGEAREAIKELRPTVFMVIFGLPWLIFELIPIYFFTRPKIKEQFQL